MVVLALFLGLVLGAFAAWLLASRQRAAAGRELSDTRSKLAATRAELDVERRSFDQKVVTAVRAASADAYQANSSAFLEIAESKLTGYVRPLKESLAKVEGQVQTLELARERSQGALREQLTQLSERTASLVTALRTPHVRGRWGEIQLKRVVELAGMTAGSAPT
jgi:DNA recombination protein RmuC